MGTVLRASSHPFKLTTDKGEYTADSVIIATVPPPSG
jgi:thioredoxin reductase